MRTSICAIWQTLGETMKVLMIYCDSNIINLPPSVDTATVGELIERLKCYPLDQKVVLASPGKYGAIKKNSGISEIEYREEYDMWRSVPRKADT